MEEARFGCWIEERIRNTDTDQFGHVNNTAIAGYCEAGRIALFAGSDLEAEMAPFTIVVARLLIEFKAELFYPGHVRIGSRVDAFGRSSAAITQTLLGPTGLVATSEAVCVLKARTDGIAARVPDAVRLALGHGERA